MREPRAVWGSVDRGGRRPLPPRRRESSIGAGGTPNSTGRERCRAAPARSGLAARLHARVIRPAAGRAGGARDDKRAAGTPVLARSLQLAAPQDIRREGRERERDARLTHREQDDDRSAGAEPREHDRRAEGEHGGSGQRRAECPTRPNKADSPCRDFARLSQREPPSRNGGVRWKAAVQPLRHRRHAVIERDDAWRRNYRTEGSEERTRRGQPPVHQAFGLSGPPRLTAQRSSRASGWSANRAPAVTDVRIRGSAAPRLVSP